MQRLKAGWLVPFSIPLILLSCTTDVCGCTPAFASAVVYGSVASPTTAPAAGAIVHAYSAPAENCAVDEVFGSELGSNVTRADGTFDLVIGGGLDAEDICVFVYAQPPAEAQGLLVSDTTLVVLDFRFGAPQDSARVDLSLRGS